MTIDIKEHTELTLIIAYGPNDDKRVVENKDMFYENLQNTVNEAKCVSMIMGDLNGRMGNDPTGYGRVTGKDSINDNGERLLTFFWANNFSIANTMFPHKNIDLWTRNEPARNEKSITDYIRIKQEMLRYVRDVKVKRGLVIGSDHHLFMMVKAIKGKTTKPRRV